MRLRVFTEKLTRNKKPSGKTVSNFFFCLKLKCAENTAKEEEETKLIVCVRQPTCVFVVGGGLWPLCGAALLEKEGGSFDHEETLAEAGKSRGGKSSQRSENH